MEPKTGRIQKVWLPLVEKLSKHLAQIPSPHSPLGSSTILKTSIITPPSPAAGVTADAFSHHLREWYAHKNLPRYKVLSLFSGGGGLDIAFHDAGFEVTEMVEKDALCVQTLKHNSQPGKLLEGARAVCADVETFEPAEDRRIDFIIGGPPCQSFSAAGRRMAGVSGTSSPGGRLFEHYVRLLKTLQPKGFLFENVLGLLSAQQGSAWQSMRAAFIAAGYRPAIHVLDSADYGVPQHRERVIVIGVREGDFHFPAPTHGPRATTGIPHITAGQALHNSPVVSKEPMPEPPNGKYGHLLADVPPGLNYTFYTERMGHPRPVFSWRSKFSDFLYKADPEDPTRTLKANGGPYSGPFHWDNRPFTLSELKRLQTFPDDYELMGGRRTAFRQLGNAVPPQLGRIMALAVREQLFNEVIPVQLSYLALGDDVRSHRPKHFKTAVYNTKAQLGFAALSPAEPTKISEKESSRYLTSSFGWQITAADNATPLRVKIKVKDSVCTIRVEQHMRAVRPTTHYTLVLTPTPGYTWPLAAKEIRLQGTDDSGAVFTACWKAFQEFVGQEGHLADLVQLSGYYYFPQQLTTKLKIHPQKAQPNWLAIVQHVVAGRGVGEILDGDVLAEYWSIQTSEIQSSLMLLHGLGYEVRGHNINPQIPVGKYLIPYSFPTLTPHSPHRRQQLRGVVSETH